MPLCFGSFEFLTRKRFNSSDCWSAGDDCSASSDADCLAGYACCASDRWLALRQMLAQASWPSVKMMRIDFLFLPHRNASVNSSYAGSPAGMLHQ